MTLYLSQQEVVISCQVALFDGSLFQRLISLKQLMKLLTGPAKARGWSSLSNNPLENYGPILSSFVVGKSGLKLPSVIIIFQYKLLTKPNLYF